MKSSAIEKRTEANFTIQWVRVSLLSLLIVAILGTAMRYKIAFSMPWLPQKNVLNAHSHFAFAGWLTQVLMVLLIHYLSKQQILVNLKKYRALLWANLLMAYGMLIAFPFEGYGPVAISFSTGSILVSYVFAFVYWKDLNRVPGNPISCKWFKAAVLFNAVSSLGPLALSYMMMNHIMHERWYLGAIYFFLHFQYNGWFFFACAGLLYSGNKIGLSATKYIFWLLALSCIPAYLLSILWANLPAGAYSLTAVAALMQLIGWAALLMQARKGKIALLIITTKTVWILFVFAAIAGSIKFLLQTGSLHPVLAKLAFGFRPIVIGYLHLVLLGMLTIFILAYLKHLSLIAPGGWRKKGIIIFIAGIIIQEILLMLQGTMSIAYISTPYITEMLFGSALILLLGLLLLNIGMSRKIPENNLPTSDA